MSSDAFRPRHSPDAQPPGRLRSMPTRLLSLVAMRSDRLVSDGLARADARKWHYAALTALSEEGPASQAELSRRTGIYRSDLVAVINELVAQGHVERRPSPVDRRRNVVTLTPRGRTHLTRLDELLTALEDEVLAPLTAAERAQLTELLTRLHDHHARRDGEDGGSDGGDGRDDSGPR